MLSVAVIKETAEDEHRVALVPESVKRLQKLGVRILVQDGAGDGAGFFREEYESAGASIVDYDTLVRESRVFLKVQCVCLQDGMMKIVDPFPEGSVIIGFFNPFKYIHNVEELAGRGLSTFSMELIPRISRAQRMDALSAMSSAAGYKAILMAANSINKMFPLMMTAAGTISPAQVLVLGAGVAGLQAIATARRLGAKVRAFDTRPVVREQVQSLGADFITLEIPEEPEGEGGYATEMSEDFYRHEQAVIARQLPEVDVIVSTAQVFGKRAPLLITEEMVRTMRHGSVIVDLAAEQGGNCELTIPGRIVERYGVSIIGETNLPSRMSYHASEMFSRNVTAFLQVILRNGEIEFDTDDEVVREAMLTHDGRIMNKHVIGLLERAAEASS
jgi:NAD(P) transhydrogenase subunit alpha